MRRYAFTTALVVLGLGSGVALAACGGDSTPETPIVVSSTTPTGLTKEEFISQADAICATANTQIADIAAAGEGISRAADVADIRQGVVTDIQALGTPVDDGSSSSSSSSSSTTDPTATATSSDLSTFPGSDTSSSSTDSTSTTS